MAGGQTLSAYLEPHLHRELHVYITSRTFGKNGGQLFSRLPGGIKQLATDCGFAHFMLVVEDRSVGTLHQFDFGPHGADTHISLPRLRRRKRATGVPGEVREAQVSPQLIYSAETLPVFSRHLERILGALTGSARAARFFAGAPPLYWQNSCHPSRYSHLQ